MQTNNSNSWSNIRKNFRKFQEVVTNKLSLMQYLLLGQAKSVSENVSRKTSGFVKNILKARFHAWKTIWNQKIQLFIFLTKKLLTDNILPNKESHWL